MTALEHLNTAIQTARDEAAAELAERARASEPSSPASEACNRDEAATPARDAVLAAVTAPAEIVVSVRALPPSVDSPTQIKEIRDIVTLT